MIVEFARVTGAAAAGAGVVAVQQAPAERAQHGAAGDLHDRHRQPEQLQHEAPKISEPISSTNELIATCAGERLPRGCVGAVGHREEHRRAADRIDDRQEAADDQQQDGLRNWRRSSAIIMGKRAAASTSPGAAARYTSTPLASPRAGAARRCRLPISCPPPVPVRLPRGHRAPAPAAGRRARALRARPDGRTRGCATSSRAPRPRVWRSTRSTHARLDALAGHGRHQGVVAIVDDALPHVTLDDVLEIADRAAAAAGPRRRDRSAQPGRLPAQRRRVRRAGGVVPKDRAVGVNATVAKAACGAADTVPVIAVTNLARTMREMKERGVWLLGADAGGESLLRRRPDRPGRVGAGRGGRGTAPPHARIVRPHRRHPARRQRREPQRVGRRGHLPLRDARRAGAAQVGWADPDPRGSPAVMLK